MDLDNTCMPSQRKPVSFLQTVQTPAFPAAWTGSCWAASCLEVALDLNHLSPDLGEVAAGLDQLVHLLGDQVGGGVLPPGLGGLPATSQATTDQDENKEDDKKDEEQSDEEKKGNKTSVVSKAKSRVPQVHCQLLKSPPETMERLFLGNDGSFSNSDKIF